ncbi:NAD-dependent epimerase/dehydratase family protein [Pseudomonadota bacterium]
MKVLITGACGFVGSELTRGLIKNGKSPKDIIGIDNLSRRGAWLNREELTGLGVTVLHGDIRNAADLESFENIDCVIDAAANASVMAGVDGKSTSRQLVENNLFGTVNLLELCKRQGASFILLSTSRVYSIDPLASLEVEVQDKAFTPSGDTELTGFSPKGITEEFSTAAPVSLYGATKLSSEQLAMEYGMAFDFPVWINRCSVMAGAGQFARADQGIFSFWLHSWKENQPLKYIGFDGQGNQVRDCLHPRDLIPLLLKQMQTPNDDRPAIINLSGGLQAAMSLAQLSNWCEQRWGTRPVAVDAAPRPFDLPWVVLDHSLATQTWGWRPESTLEQVLSEIADFAETHNHWIEQSA